MNKQPMRRYFRQIMQQRRGSNRRSYVTELENLQVLFALYMSEVTAEQAAEFIGCEIDELDAMREKAMKAGKELAR